MSDQNSDTDSGQLTKESILESLKKEGITDLDDLAAHVVKHSQAGGGGPVIADTFCGNWWCVTKAA